ncbi:hypothetical protein HDU67_004769 [Dinochytrium kinnereticum]|nr:hypothetical protein HDU67_004769 [Dinochytrium kinnereticum]
MTVFFKASEFWCGDLTSVPDDQLAQATQLLIQITASLRNLASTQPFVNGNAISNLMCLTHESFGLTDSSDLMLNVSRILSKLSLHPDCLDKMKGETSIQALLQLVVKYQNHKRDPQALLVRILFVLGNLTAVKGPEHISLLNGIGDIAALLGIYSAVTMHKMKKVAKDSNGRRLGWDAHADIGQSNSGSPLPVSVKEGDDEDGDEVTLRIDRENTDVMVKLVRVLANLALHPECGRELVQMIEVETLVEMLGYSDIDREEELVLNIAGALANFTFYLNSENCLLPHTTRILELMVPLMLCNNPEAVSEASRVYGNLSRLEEARQWMSRNKGGTELLAVLMDHSDTSVLENICGALANVLTPTADAAGRRIAGENAKILMKGCGFSKLTEIVEESVNERDLSIAVVASKALSNLLSISAVLPPDQLEDLISTKEEERLANILMNSMGSETMASATDETSENSQGKSFERIAKSILEHLGYYEVDGNDGDEASASPTSSHPPARQGNWVEAGVGPAVARRLVYSGFLANASASNSRIHSAMTVEDLKAQGNKAFSSGDFKTAIKFFSQAIEQDSSNHVLFSNRSASYASLKDYVNALDDADKTIEINPNWAKELRLLTACVSKGYSRKAAALYGLSRYKESVEACQAGLAIEPSNAQMQKALSDAEAALADLESNGLAGGFGKLFAGDVFSKIANNPKISHLLTQPDFIQKVRDCQANPSNIERYMQDPRMMSLVFALMGIDATAGGMPMDEDVPEPPAPKPAEKPAPPPPEPVEEVTDEEKEKRAKRAASDKEKESASAAYKKRDFEAAIAGYERAWELDETNIAVLTNKSAVLFEMGRFDECIKLCEEAVEKGRELRADFKLIARAFGRIGSAYLKKEDYANAIKFYQKSLSEHRTPDVLNKLREVEKMKEKADKEAYRSIPLSDEAREKGNVLFKESKYAQAVPLYTEAIKRNDKDPRNYSNRAACYMKLMAFPEAEKDCEDALKLDENFIKAYIRKAAILHAKKDYMKAIEVCQDAKARDSEGKHTAEIEGQMMKCYMGLNEVQSGANREETVKRAMSDPEVQKVLGDPVMQSILQQMKEDPAAAADHMKNPGVAAKIRILVNAGIIQMR